MPIDSQKLWQQIKRLEHLGHKIVWNRNRLALSFPCMERLPCTVEKRSWHWSQISGHTFFTIDNHLYYVKNVLYFGNNYSITSFDLYSSYNFILRNKFNSMRLCHQDCNNMISAEHLNLLLECLFLRDGVFKFNDHCDYLKDTVTAIILFICAG